MNPIHPWAATPDDLARGDPEYTCQLCWHPDGDARCLTCGRSTGGQWNCECPGGPTLGPCAAPEPKPRERVVDDSRPYMSTEEVQEFLKAYAQSVENPDPTLYEDMRLSIKAYLKEHWDWPVLDIDTIAEDLARRLYVEGWM